jgi:hypothetical protein
MYGPALGRFLHVDPLADKAPDWTPYRYGFNNPLKFIDPTGMFEHIFEEQEDGSWEMIEKNDNAVDEFRFRDGTVKYVNKDGSAAPERVDINEVNEKVASMVSGNTGFDQRGGDVVTSKYSAPNQNETTSEHVSKEIDGDFITGSPSAGGSKGSMLPVVEGFLQAFSAISEFSLSNPQNEPDTAIGDDPDRGAYMFKVWKSGGWSPIWAEDNNTWLVPSAEDSAKHLDE